MSSARIGVAIVVTSVLLLYVFGYVDLWAASVYKSTIAMNWSMTIAGGIASCPAEFFTTPLEVAKVRIQVGTASKEALGLLGTILAIGRNEGMFALWKGATPALLRQFIYQSVKMMSYAYLRDGLLSLFLSDSEMASFSAPVWLLVLAGGLAGSLGAWITNPFDVIKVRSQANASHDTSSVSLYAELFRLYDYGGLSALWAGAMPSCQRAFLVNAAELATYDYFKGLIVENGILGGKTLGTHLFSSLMSGLVASIVSAPIDRCKTLLMTADPTDANPVGMMSSLQGMYRTHGIFGLYRGFFATWLRLAPWNMLFFVTFELCHNILNKK